MIQGEKFYFHHGWHFLLADAFPMQDAFDKWKDSQGHYFYEPEYLEKDWEEVTLPHTFNDKDLFRDRIQDAGSGQKRTCAFYRNWFTVPEKRKGQKVLVEFERVRQTCYLYVNGQLVGYYEAGVAPFGFDLTPYLKENQPNLVAIATDNTDTRNIACCIAETPNMPDVKPGSYLLSQETKVPAEQEGVPFFWNCNDFNPSVGGLTHPVKLYYKPEVYLTLPLYSNLQTKGVYVYGKDFLVEKKRAKVAVEAEVRNEGTKPVEAWLEVIVKKLSGETCFQFTSERTIVEPVGKVEVPFSIVPQDAYKKEILENGALHYVPEEEDQVAPTATDSVKVSVLKGCSREEELRFWSIDDPYLYQTEVRLYVNGEWVDTERIETGYRKVSYDKDKGILINEVPVWLTGYAQRATNEWAAIGNAPEWLKDMDAKLIRENNANHIRWMHVAAAPADIRSYDRHGVVCTQPAGDKEKENFGRQWDQRVELMRDIIIAFRNHPSIFFWEAGNNSINKEHMREMRLLKEKLDPCGGRFMGCRTINTEEVLVESEYVGTMLNRHAARFLAEHGPITETEYSREEAPRRIWDDFTPPDYDYKNKWIGRGGKKQVGRDFYDLTAEDLALAEAAGYSEFFNDRIGGASKHDWYSACAGLCWTDSAQHGRQSFSENGRMSGRVDPIRIKKQNFDVYQVMQSPVPKVKIFGHWNYPQMEGTNYQYQEKSFNGSFWEENGTKSFRNPKEKTVYVYGSYDVARVELFVNERLVGSCDKPVNTFVFPIEKVDITESGKVEVLAYDYDGKLIASDALETCGEPARIRLTVHTSPEGLQADGADVAYVDVEVLDSKGRICPLCDSRIDFTLEGEGIFLGGYNSGRFAGYGKDDSVIHENHVYAECGINRVFVRSTRKAGKLALHATMEGVREVCIDFESVRADLDPLTKRGPVVWYEAYPAEPPVSLPAFPANERADAAKYVPEKERYCKMLYNGQEPDTRGVRSVNKKGSVWGAVLCMLERMQSDKDLNFEFTYDEQEQKLTLVSGGQTVTAQAGHTHLLVNGVENLMDGEPYVTPEGIFVMEANAVLPYVEGVSCRYDEKVNVLRVEKVSR